MSYSDSSITQEQETTTKPETKRNRFYEDLEQLVIKSEKTTIKSREYNVVKDKSVRLDNAEFIPLAHTAGGEHSVYIGYFNDVGRESKLKQGRMYILRVAKYEGMGLNKEIDQFGNIKLGSCGDIDLRMHMPIIYNPEKGYGIYEMADLSCGVHDRAKREALTEIIDPVDLAKAVEQGLEEIHSSSGLFPADANPDDLYIYVDGSRTRMEFADVGLSKIKFGADFNCQNSSLDFIMAMVQGYAPEHETKTILSKNTGEILYNMFCRENEYETMNRTLMSYKPSIRTQQTMRFKRDRNDYWGTDREAMDKIEGELDPKLCNGKQKEIAKIIYQCLIYEQKSDPVGLFKLARKQDGKNCEYKDRRQQSRCRA